MAKKHNAPAKPALEPNEALFQAVSLCRKAGALTMGFDAVEDAVVKGKAWLVMTASMTFTFLFLSNNRNS